MKQGLRIHLVRRVVREDSGVDVIREGSTGRVVTMLPRVWAVAETEDAGGQEAGLKAHGVEAAPVGVAAGAPAARLKPEVEVAFYRKYTVALLRRYLRLSMEAGRVPSLLGRELFRGHVTSYKVKSFEDVVIFCYDVERCLRRLDEGELDLIKRIALQEYSQGEAAAMLGMSLRHCAQKYGRTLDRLTKVLLEARLLEPLKSCQ
jgi:hypothetical protein